MDFDKISDKLVKKELSPNDILLDHLNPRFKGEADYPIDESANPADSRVQGRILAFLKKNSTYGVIDLKKSIIKIGFLKMDRIVVRKSGDKYIVLEGNRRIAAIKLLLEDVEHKGVQLNSQVAKSIKKLEVLELTDGELSSEEIKKATWFLQGLRHISGVKPWGPYQQAELITQFKAEGRNFTEAGQAVGISARKAGQMLRAYNALNQMNEDDEYQDLSHPKLFSHFQQAIVKTPVREWLDYNDKENRFENINALKYFYKWITPDPENNDITILQAQDVRDKLPTILKSREALEFLKEGKDAEFCYAVAMSQTVSAPTWHSAVKQSLTKLQNIPWTYEFSKNDGELLLELHKITKALLERIDQS